MSPVTKKSGSRTRCVHLVLVEAPGSAADAAGWCERLGGRIGGEIERVPLADLPERLGQKGAIAAVLLLPSAGGASAELQQVRGLCREKDPGLPLAVAADGLDGATLSRLFHGGVDTLLHAGDEQAGAGRLQELIARRVARGSGELFPAGKGVPRLIGAAPAMQELARLVERVAPSEATALILGESGTGKELVARALHVFSRRRRGPFVAINCAAIPETLLENELFGHEKGAYTGANATAIGKVEAAEKGTLFLDEIGEMPLQLQAKILRLLQDHTYDRIGGTKTRKADVRIIAATNRDLKEEVAGRRFREDLYYRLSVVPLPLPPLRERPEDIPLLARALLDSLAERLGRPGLRLTEEALERMSRYRWPGNVRELENELERAAVLSHGDEILPENLELRARVDDPDLAALGRLAPLDGPLQRTLDAVLRSAEKLRIALALERAGEDHDAAAAELGLTPDDLRSRLSSD